MLPRARRPTRVGGRPATRRRTPNSPPTCAAELGARGPRRRRAGPRAAHRARQAAAPRPGRRAARPRLARSWSSSPLAADGMYDGEAPAAGIITGIGRVSGRECVIVANDATVKGGTYYPMTVKKHLRAQEVALAEPAALRLPGRLRRRLPAHAGRGLPRPRALRPDLLQPGRPCPARGIPQIAAVLGLVHGRRRLRPGDERRGGDRPRPGHDLPRRPAAGEGRDRRGRHRRGAGRRRRCTPGSPASPTTSPRTTRTRCASSATSSPPSRRARRPALGRRARRGARASTRTALYGAVPADSRTPYDVREVIARLVDGSRFAGVQGRVRARRWSPASPGIHGHPVGIVANNGILFAESALKGAHFIELCDQREHPAAVPAEHLRLHGRPGLRGRRHRQARRQDGHRRGLRPGAQADRGDRRLVRRGQLLDVRPGLLAPLPVDVAQRHDLGDGRRAGRVACWPPSGATRSRPAARSGRPRTRRRSRPRSATQYERQGNAYYATARLWDDGVIDPAGDPHRARPRPDRLRQRPAGATSGYGVFRM